MQWDLDRTDEWTGGIFIKLNKGKCRVLHLVKSNPRHHYRLGT